MRIRMSSRNPKNRKTQRKNFLYPISKLHRNLVLYIIDTQNAVCNRDGKNDWMNLGLILYLFNKE